MGANLTTAVGPKSTHKDEGSDEVDYKDPRNEARARNELYNLFQEDKIVHVAKLEEAEDKIQRLERENAELKSTLDKYRKLNESPTPLTPRPVSHSQPIRPHHPENDTQPSTRDDLSMRIDRLAAKIKAGQAERRAASHPISRRIGSRSSQTVTERISDLGRVEEGDETSASIGASGSGD
jgi:chromatin segregation and condensation protein Rec8/ScpA/Scc1 (kleisin family)